MRVLHVIPSMNPDLGGSCQGIRNSVPELEKLGISNEVLCLDANDANYIGTDSFVLHTIGPASGPWGYSSNLIPWLEEHYERFDVIIINGLWQYHSYAVTKFRQALNNKVAAAKTPKIFVMPHGMLDPWFQQAKERRVKAIRNWIYWKILEKQTVNQADGLFFTCREELLLARKTFLPYRPKMEYDVGYGILPPPAYTEKMKSAFIAVCEELHKPFLLFLSRIDIKKGVDLLIGAYKKLQTERSELPALVIAGPGIDSEYGKQITRMADNDPDIIFPGMLTGDAKWGAFYLADAFVLPSHQENFGIAVVEALACGTPVLISDQINIYPDIKSENSGLVESDTPEGAYKLLRDWVLLGPDKQKKMADDAVICYQEHFTIEKAAIKMAKALLGNKTLS